MIDPITPPQNPWPARYDEGLALGTGIAAALSGIRLPDGRSIPDADIYPDQPEWETGEPDSGLALAVIFQQQGTSDSGLKGAVLAEQNGWVCVRDDDVIGTMAVECWGETMTDRSLLKLAVRETLAPQGALVKDLHRSFDLPDYYPGTESRARVCYHGSVNFNNPGETMRRHRIGQVLYRFWMPTLRVQYVGEGRVKLRVNINSVGE